MRREEFDHVIAAAADIVGEDSFVVIGSQAILGSYADAPGDLLVSMEVDLYPRDDPEKAGEFEGVLGDGSQFHRTFGYYAHAVGPETAKAPAGWEERLIPVVLPRRGASERSPVAYCLEPHDLVLAKCVRNDVRDWEYAGSALRSGLVSGATLLVRVDDLPIDDERRVHLRAMLDTLIGRETGAV